MVAQYDVKNTSRGAFMDYLKVLKAGRNNPVNFWHIVGNKGETAGTTNYFVPTFTLGEAIQDDEGMLDTLRDTMSGLSDWINGNNEAVVSQFNKINGFVKTPVVEEAAAFDDTDVPF